jgi:hypothetical protein
MGPGLATSTGADLSQGIWVGAQTGRSFSHSARLSRNTVWMVAIFTRRRTEGGLARTRLSERPGRQVRIAIAQSAQT